MLRLIRYSMGLRVGLLQIAVFFYVVAVAVRRFVSKVVDHFRLEVRIDYEERPR